MDSFFAGSNRGPSRQFRMVFGDHYEDEEEGDKFKVCPQFKEINNIWSRRNKTPEKVQVPGTKPSHLALKEGP